MDRMGREGGVSSHERMNHVRRISIRSRLVSNNEGEVKVHKRTFWIDRVTTRRAVLILLGLLDIYISYLVSWVSGINIACFEG